MDGTLLKTAGIITIGIGMYMVYKGMEMDGIDFRDLDIDKDIIDVEFEILEE